MLGDCNGGVVTGLNDDPAQQRFKRYLRTFTDEHAGAFSLPGVHADVDHVGEFDSTRLDFFGRDKTGHDLGQTGRRFRIMRPVLNQNLLAGGINQQIGGRGNGWWFGNRHRAERKARECREALNHQNE